jgi:NADH:ubiquinone oxidoreductase subunit 6 (subunit J)
MDNFIIKIILILLILILLAIHFTNNYVNIILLTLFSFILTGLLFLCLGSDYLAFMFLIIYAGAIVILFICCFMLMTFKSVKRPLNLNELFLILISLILLYYIGCNIFIDSNILVNFLYIFVFNIPQYIMNLPLFSYIYLMYNYFLCTNYIQLSQLSQIGVALFKAAWFETLFLGSLILIAIVIIIYLFKK